MCEKIYKCMPFVKGQVWLVREPEIVTDALIQAGTHLQVKTRPYLIYMAESSAQLKFNIVQGFPISSNSREDSTKDRTFYDFDIRFQNPDGQTNRIITGQLTSIDIRYMAKYLFTLPMELLDEIDSLMGDRFGLGGHITQLSSRIESMKKELDMLTKQAGDVFNQFNYELHDNGVINPISLKRDKEAAPVIKPTEKALAINRTKKGRIRWNSQYAKLFLEHCEKKPREDVSKIWCIPINSIAPTKTYCKKLLGV